MKYQSTRGSEVNVTAEEAITGGLAGDGGLYVPQSYPGISLEYINRLIPKTYSQRAADIIGLFLEKFDADELDTYTKAAYNNKTFGHPGIAPLHQTDGSTYFLELWHGPTAAFKDMALQIMPHLLTASLRKLGEQREVCILAATSGDTGKAALEGYCDVHGTRIMVFYPKDGVSDIQKLQMTSQRGSNVNVTAVRGNFDDTQTGVKEIFKDITLAAELDRRGIFLSSANSINWGRLVPQIAYYISAYCDLIKSGAIRCGDKINFCVPTGNFGNILAGYYAYKMGLPVNKLICASNRNDVLTQFINTGVYDKNRTFYTTISPSMDILISSNLERLLFELSGRDGEVINTYMSALAVTGSYKVPEQVLTQVRSIFASGYCSEEDTKKTIADVWADNGYLIDTHTAVAHKALRDYRAAYADKTPSVVISTASPYKFCGSVLEALGQPAANTGVELIDMLSDFTKVNAPAPLLNLKNAGERFDAVVDVSGMRAAVINFIDKQEHICHCMQ